MTPLFACLPVCMTFAVICLIALIVVVFGLANRIPGDDEATTPVEPRIPGQKMGPPPWWVFPLMLLAAVGLVLALSWCYAD